MTNLIATIVVCVVTNITTADNSSGCALCSASPGTIPAVMHYGTWEPCKPYVPATEKTETTEAVEIKRLSFEWEGETYTAKRERVLWRKVKRWIKRETWEVE